MLDTITQNPNERLRYDINYSQWLYSGDEIGTVSITISPTTTTPLQVSWQITADDSGNDTIVSLTIYGGEADEDYSVVVLATTTVENELVEECLPVLIREACDV